MYPCSMFARPILGLMATLVISGASYAAPGDLLRTFTEPNTIFYGIDVAMNEQVAIVVGGERTSNGYSPIAAFAYDLRTGDELYKLPSDFGTGGIGTAIAIDGSVAITGVSDQNAYTFDVQTGQQLQQLSLPNLPSGSYSYSDVAIDGDFGVIGLPREGAGAVYTYDLVTGTQLQKFTPPDIPSAPLARFGSSVAVHDQWAVVGAEGSNHQVFAYVYDISTGNEVFSFQFSGTYEEPRVSAVAINEEYVIVGARYNSSRGVAHVFDRETGMQLFELTGDLANVGLTFFGSAVDIEGHLAIIGEPSEYSHGSLYFFDLRTGNRVLKIDATENSIGSFGGALDMAGNKVIAGAWHAFVDGSEGAAYIYTLVPEPNSLVMAYWALAGAVPMVERRRKSA